MDLISPKEIYSFLSRHVICRLIPEPEAKARIGKMGRAEVAPMTM